MSTQECPQDLVKISPLLPRTSPRTPRDSRRRLPPGMGQVPSHIFCESLLRSAQGNGRNAQGNLHDFSKNSHGRSPRTGPRIWSRPPRTFQILQRSSPQSFPLSPCLFARLPQGLPETIAQECPPGFGKGPPRTLQDFPPGLPQGSRPRMSPGFGQGSLMTLQDFSTGLPQGNRP